MKTISILSMAASAVLMLSTSASAADDPRECEGEWFPPLVIESKHRNSQPNLLYLER